MVITVHNEAGACVLRLQGRLDANWADHVANAMESTIRAGQHELQLDFAEVSYLSSAGIRVLLKFYRQLKSVGGFLRVLRPTEAVLSVLRLAGLAQMFLTGEPLSAPGPTPPVATKDALPRRWQRAEVDFESYPLSAGGPMEGELLGYPEALSKGQLSAAQAKPVRCSSDLLAVGLGAFGVRPEDTETRFGESLAVAGVGVTQPTDGSSVPDFQVSEGQLVPELHLLYGLTGRGQFSHLLRFEAVRSERGVVSLASLVEAVLEELQLPTAALVILAESASVVGAMLKRSPALAAGQPLLAFPAVRDWLTFTTERTDERNLVLITGFIVRAPEADTVAFVRPIGPGTDAQGHFHAAVFPYRPLVKGKLDLREAVASVLATESAQAVLHLLADERQFEGVGQTDLMRGACWAGPVRFVAGAPPAPGVL